MLLAEAEGALSSGMLRQTRGCWLSLVVHRVPSVGRVVSAGRELCGDPVVLVGDERDDVVAKRFELAEVVGQRPDEHALRSACGVGADAFGALLSRAD